VSGRARPLPPVYAATMSVSSSAAFTTPTNDNTTAQLGGNPFFSPSNDGSFWDGVGGPALVVILVAVGLLSSLLGVLLLLRHRRLQFDDNDDDEFEYGPLTVNRLRKRRLGPKPKIFELPIAYEKEDYEKMDVEKWTGIVPISAVFVAEKTDRPWSRDPEKASTGSPTSSNASPTCGSTPPVQPSTLAYSTPEPATLESGSFSWRYLRRSSTVSETHAPPSPEPAPEPALVPDTIHVAVAIAMPHPPSPSAGRSTPETATRSSRSATPTVVPELCLGIAQVQGVDEVRWSELHATAAQEDKEE